MPNQHADLNPVLLPFDDEEIDDLFDRLEAGDDEETDEDEDEE